MKLSSLVTRSAFCVYALVALPALLFAQGGTSDEPTTITVLESGELQITGDFVVELTGSFESDPIGEVWIDRGNHTTRGERGYVVEDKGFRITGEAGGVGYYSNAIIGARKIIISKVIEQD